jgi:hypothetical protein
MYSSGLKREVAEKILKTLKWKFVRKDGYVTRFEALISDEAMRTLIALEKTPLRQLKTARTKRTVKEITQAVAIGALLR